MSASGKLPEEWLCQVVKVRCEERVIRMILAPIESTRCFYEWTLGNNASHCEENQLLNSLIGHGLLPIRIIYIYWHLETNISHNSTSCSSVKARTMQLLMCSVMRERLLRMGAIVCIYLGTWQNAVEEWDNLAIINCSAPLHVRG